MKDDVLWRIMENHFWKCRNGYFKEWIICLPYDKNSYLLQIVIKDKKYRALISGIEDCHFYAFECVNEGEPLMPESWITTWDEPLSEKERNALK